MLNLINILGLKSILIALLFISCDGETENNTSDDMMVDTMNAVTLDTVTFASVTNVTVSGQSGRYSFAVTISSPDTGCEQYADWWEVVGEDGTLLYRRILAHSHVLEQPFTRSGGSVPISETQHVWVMAHMNNTGYGLQGMFGSVSEGFESQRLPVELVDGLARQQPLPTGCAF